MDGERLIRTEKVKAGMLGGDGWLTVTSQRLVFGKSDQLGKKEKWSAPLANVESVRAKKAFRAGTEVLEVLYRTEKGRREQKSFERFSVAQWANAGAGRVEQNSLAGLEQAVFAAREALFASGSQPPGAKLETEDPIGQLERLAQLRSDGALTEDEFRAA